MRLESERCHGDIGKAAGADPLKRLQGVVHVEGQSVKRDAVADGDAETSQLFVAYPNAAAAGISAGIDTEMAGGADHHLFQGVDPIHYLPASRREVDQGISDQLPGPVVGHRSASFHGKHGDPLILKEFSGHAKMLRSAAAPVGQDGKMFDKEKHVSIQKGITAQSQATVLQGQGGLVIQKAQIHKPT